MAMHVNNKITANAANVEAGDIYIVTVGKRRW